MKNIKKFSKIISAIIVLTMLLSNITAFASEREITASGVYKEINWTLYNDGELRIDGEGTMPNATNSYSMPWHKSASNITQITIGKNVTFDSNSALAHYNSSSMKYSNLEKVSVEEGNTSVSCDENGVLYNFNKTEIILFPAAIKADEYTVPSSVKVLGEGSFSASKVKKIIISKNVTSIKSHAFYNAALAEIEFLGKGITFGSEAFAYCNSLKSFVFPAETTNVSTQMFEYCSNLTSVTLNESIKKIGFSAFRNCKKLKEITLPESIIEINAWAFENCESLESITIPNNVPSINNYTFDGCTNLKSVILGSKVSSVSSSAFENCSSLENVTVNSNLTDTDISNIIKYSKNLKSLTINGDNDWISFDENGVLFNKDKTELIRYIPSNTASSYVVPDSVVRISEFAFAYASSLAEITLPETIEYIGANAFLESAFYNLASNWDKGFLHLGNCLIAVNPDQVAENCTIFTKVVLIASNVFEESKITSLNMTDNVKYINDCAFESCIALESVRLSENLEILGEGAFRGCSLLGEIKIPEKVKELKAYTFYNTDSLSTVTLCDGLESIGENAFAYSDKLKEIELPQTVSHIDSTAFAHGAVTDIYYGSTKADWKNATKNNSLGNMIIHYTLRTADDSVMIQHTDENFIWEAGNVHLVASEITPATPGYDRNGYYVKGMMNPVKVLDIKIVDGDGAVIQPEEGETITVKIKAPDEFISKILTMLNADGEIDFDTVEYSNGVFTYEQDGKKITVTPPEADVKTLKIVHWFSDGTEPGNYEEFLYDAIEIRNGYIIIETNHFSDYAICTEAETDKEYTISFDTDGGSEIAPITLLYGSKITPPAAPQKDGYVFIGWSSEIPETMPALNQTFVAKYKKITGIQIITAPTKTQYTYKTDGLSLTGIALNVMLEDGTSKVITDEKLIETSGFDAKSVGTQTVTVEYSGFTAEYNVTVSYTWWQMIIRILLLGFLWY